MKLDYQRKKIPKYIANDKDISSDESDKEDSDKGNSEEEN